MSTFLHGFDWLDGSLTLQRGSTSDYRFLSRFHYAHKHPAVWSAIWTIRWTPNPVSSSFIPSGGQALPRHPSSFISRPIAVAVLSHPTPRCIAREQHFNMNIQNRYGTHLPWLNQNLRTLSRVIIHPQFRGIGLASRLVRTVCEESGVPYVEAIATMGTVHPFFEKGGMTRITSDNGKAYFIWKR